MKIISAHQPAYIPWLGLYHKLYLADEFYVYDHVEHSKYDFTAKNYLKGSAGQVPLIVPLNRGGSRILKDLTINYNQNWQKKHWITINNLYSTAPQFSRYKNYLENFYKRKWETLVEMNTEFLRWSSDLIGIDCPIKFSSTLEIVEAKDDGALELSLKVKAGCLIFGQKGEDYCNVQNFIEKKIYPYFQKYEHPEYPQRHGVFMRNMSIIDLLMNVEPDKCLEVIISGNLSREKLRGTLYEQK